MLGNKGKITQNLPNLKQMLVLSRLHDVKDKQTFLGIQELNFLMQADELDKNGNSIKYNTRSQALTRLMLKRLEKLGYVENVESTKAKKSRLFLEKIMLGNIKDVGKATAMYDITFHKTGKKITKDDISALLGIPQEELEKMFSISLDKEGMPTGIDYKLRELFKTKGKQETLALPSTEKKTGLIISRNYLTRLRGCKGKLILMNTFLWDQAIKKKDRRK